MLCDSCQHNQEVITQLGRARFVEPADVPQDPELAAIARLAFMIEKLKVGARQRVVAWLRQRFQLSDPRADLDLRTSID